MNRNGITAEAKLWIYDRRSRSDYFLNLFLFKNILNNIF